MLVMHCKQSTINAKGNCLVENREISHTRKGPMKEGIRTSRARTPIINSQHHNHLPFFGQTSHFHPPGSRLIGFTCKGCKGASFGEQILLLGRAGEDILHTIHFRKDLGDHTTSSISEKDTGCTGGWDSLTYPALFITLSCVILHETRLMCWFQFERQEQILTEEMPSTSQYNCESSQWGIIFWMKIV